MPNATTKTRTRKARAVSKDIVPKGPCVGFEAIEHLVWRARAASAPPAVYVDLSGFDDALASVRSNADDAIAEHKARAEEYDRQEQAIRRPVRLPPTDERHVPVAVVTKSGAFYQLTPDGLAAQPMAGKPKKALDEFLRLHAEQDGTPQTDPGPAAPSPLVAQPPTGPGSPQDDPALDKAPGE